MRGQKYFPREICYSFLLQCKLFIIIDKNTCKHSGLWVCFVFWVKFSVSLHYQPLIFKTKKKTMLQSVGYLPYTVYWAIKNVQLIVWNYECPECYQHSKMSVFLSSSSSEGPINNICLASLPAWAPC